MNLNNPSRVLIYLGVLSVFIYLLLREYVYVQPFNTGFFILGPKWTYASTRTFTWWFLLISAIVMITPLFHKQKIGFFGLFLLIAVFVRPLIQIKFPQEKAIDFYKDRKEELNQIVKQYRNDKNRTISNSEIKELGFEKLIINQDTYYFMVCDEEWPFGVCYNDNGELPIENFDRRMQYTELDKNWYEFDY